MVLAILCQQKQHPCTCTSTCTTWGGQSTIAGRITPALLQRMLVPSDRASTSLPSCGKDDVQSMPQTPKPYHARAAGRYLQ